MFTSSTCPKCGYANPANTRFCASCATQLAFSSPYREPQQLQSVPPAEWYGSGYGNPAEIARSIDIERTKTGLLLVAAGILLGPVPYVMYIGAILATIGVIMVIFGRNSFDTNHSNYVFLSVVIYCLGFAITVIAGFYYGFSSITASQGLVSQATIESKLILAFDDFLTGLLVGGAIIGVAYVVFTYTLQDSAGRILLYIAFATHLVVAVLIASVISQQVAGTINQSLSSGSVYPSLLAHLQLLQLLSLIPAAIFALAYYKAYSRIQKREVPF